ncbi:DUF397 domain-containing protein [Streptomyces sp. NBC_00984]|uniref:DUF397 domain-containing protein n=1 Tax=unclassified Streptomyces TaxID=2593676 RepID=UPI003807C630|nr:DUF397 domain-containing protein [Streptomyces sp. NBC_00984]
MSHVSDLHWVKSSFSDAGGNNCVEVAAVKNAGVAMRESESPGVVLVISRAALGALVQKVKKDAVGAQLP